MGNLTERLIRREYNGQVWYDVVPIKTIRLTNGTRQVNIGEERTADFDRFVGRNTDESSSLQT